MGESLASRVAKLSEAERKELLDGMDQEELIWDWSFWSRPEQRPPAGVDWNVWLFMAGRGAGKTRSAAEWIREKARTSTVPLRFGLIARTAADVRDVIVEGDSGILAVTPPSERPEYQPSKRKLTWPDGHTALCFTADEPDQIRGPQFHYAWADELAAWRQMPDAAGMTAWDHARVATRLGANPQIIATTTPKRTEVMKKLTKEAETGRVVITSGSTADNAGNLSQSYLDGIYGVYEGTKLARQELYGEMLDQIEGALFSTEIIDTTRIVSMPLGVPLRIVGVDPTVAERPGDDCGIVVASCTGERDLFKRHAFVLEDATVHGAPEVWAAEVVRIAKKWGAPVVAEKNQGGALIKNAIHQIDNTIPVFEVWSKQGKALRAEPVSLAYEQKRVHHLGFFAELEDQMTTWEPELAKKSPDRLDALVLALTALLILPPAGFGGGSLTAKSVAGRSIPTTTTGRTVGGSGSSSAGAFSAARSRRGSVGGRRSARVFKAE